MYICIEGCAHGDLEVIYNQIAYHESRTGVKIDLLICCGDFQATRNVEDLACMAVPAKYLEMGSFYKYYSGELIAPILTIFIGGNHEASNHLQELAYGGWVAPKIYYMGYAGVINVNNVKIGGISGIYRDYLYEKGHFEFPPYDESSLRSAYAVRNFEVFRLKQMTPSKIDIMLSHDWPQKIWEYGNRRMKFGSLEGLLRLKPAFKADMDSGKLGSPPCMELLKILKPRYWYAAHMHCRFDALVSHNETESTTFVALDKCLPRRNFFDFLEIGEPVKLDDNGDSIIDLKYDPEWLTILSLTNRFLNCTQGKTNLPHDPGSNESSASSISHQLQRLNFTPNTEEIEAILKKIDNDLSIKHNFKQTVEAYNPEWEKNFRNLKQPGPRENIQTKEFCARLNIDDPLFVAASLKRVKVISIDYSTSNDDAFKDFTESEGCDNDKVQVYHSKKINDLRLPKPVNQEEINLDDLDESEDDCDEPIKADASNNEKANTFNEIIIHEEMHSNKLSRPLENEDETERKEINRETPSSITKKFKRRNQDIYANYDD